MEAPGSTPLRALPGRPGLGHGKRSVALDLDTERARLDELPAAADVLVTTMSPPRCAGTGSPTSRSAPRGRSRPRPPAGAHGILAALLERETSGRGQRVDTDLVRGVTTLDTWNRFTELVGVRRPGAHEVVDAFTADGEPMGPMVYALLVAPTEDGHRLQFAQPQPRLFLAMPTELGLSELRTDPRRKPT
ncbi:hypothetical protein [Pseudonocardia pini]|uniref:hypothetical protein n=1 Tax=Pseudonocardia pini TaxID=2758030 RepID=UPI0015F00229|nr:hypothetical protein [Pseudonocardia pini]